MFEGTFSPPVYNDLYNFLDGAQNDIFIDSYASIPTPSPNASVPVLSNLSGTNSSTSSTTTTTSDPNSNSTSTSGKSCSKQKKIALQSASLSSAATYHRTRNMKRSHHHQSSIMAMSGQSKILNVDRPEKLWNMFDRILM